MKKILFIALLSVTITSLNAQEKLKTADYLQYTPSAFFLTQSVLQKPKNLKKDFFLFGASSLIMIPTVTLLKEKTNVLRPNKVDFRSFPSGHSAISFMGAELMSIKNPKKPLLWIGAYGVAGYVSAQRVADKQHRLLDVIGGAVIGIVSAQLSKRTCEKLLSKKVIY